MSKKCHCEEGLAEWIMSYADMITILMAFFVVMYSMAGDKNPEAKTEAVMGSLRQWLGPGREHWPMTWGIPRKRLATELDVPAPADRHRAATENVKSTVPQPNATFPDGVTIFLPATSLPPLPTESLDQQTRDELEKVVETVAGKMNLIEIRGQARRHFYRQLKASQNAADQVYQRCRVVMDHLVERGINPQRIQILIVRAEASGDESKLAAGNHDIQLDIFMLGELLKPQADVKAVNTGILD